MNPLAPWTYLVRNLGKTVPLVAVIMLAVLLISGIVSMMNSIPLSIRTVYHYSKYSLGMTPRGDPMMTPRLKKAVHRESPVPIDRIITCRVSGAQVRSIVGKWPFAVLGLSKEDADYVLNRLSTKRITGRRPAKGKPEILVSEPVARNLKLKIGSVLQGPDRQENYSPKEVKVVGIADSEEWFMINDIDYQRRNHFPPLDNLIVYAKTMEDQEKLDRWAEGRFKGQRTMVFAYHILDKQTTENFRILYLVLDVVIGTLVMVITLMMAMLINIYQGQRLVEFGLLQAIGYTSRTILKRVMIETILVVISGWMLGAGAAIALLHLVKRILMDPNAFPLATWDPIAMRYTLAVPVAIISVALITVAWRFRRFDPVAVVERRLV